MTSAMPVQCSNQLSYEVTQWRAGQFVGLMFSRDRNVSLSLSLSLYIYIYIYTSGPIRSLFRSESNVYIVICI